MRREKTEKNSNPSFRFFKKQKKKTKKSFKPYNPRMATPIGIHLLRIAIGLVYVWFGFLKLCGKCDLHELILQTLWWLPEVITMPLLGMGEVIIGLMFLYPFNMGLTLLLFFGHMMGTFLPLVLLPEMTMHETILLPNSTGQYILKNIVFLACGVLLSEFYYKKHKMQKSKTTHCNSSQAFN